MLSAVDDTTASGAICVACRLRPAVTMRRTVSYVGTWNAPEPVCAECASEFMHLAERCARGALEVDRAVAKYRKAA
jgi:hypothetical protein